MKYNFTSKRAFKNLIGPQLLILFFAIYFSFVVSSYFFRQHIISSTEIEILRNLRLFEKTINIQDYPLNHWCKIILADEHPRLTIIDVRGNVICDNISPNLTENHGQRNEILMAHNKKMGTAIRYSESLNKMMFYGAIRIMNKKEEDFFIRMALPLKSINDLISRIQLSIFLLLVPIFLILSILSLWFKMLKEDNQKRKNMQHKNDLMANISHEVRTPLTALKGYVQVLKEGKKDLPDHFKNYLDKIESNSERLTVLFRDILDLSVLENNKKLFFEVLDIKELTENIVNGVQESHKKKNIRVKCNIKIDEIEGDSKTIGQLINNLVDNAFKYTLKDGVVKIVWEKNDHMARFSVQDNGMGIPDEALPRIFERFYRVDISRSRKLGGTGLGLAIVKHGVERHNGKVWVESIQGEGSTFYFQIPMVRTKSR